MGEAYYDDTECGNVIVRHDTEIKVILPELDYGIVKLEVNKA